MVAVDLLPSDNERAAWMVVGLVLVALVTYLLYSFVGVFVFALFVYYATRPIYRRIYRVSGNTGLSATVSLVAIVLPILALVAYAVSVGIEQLQAADANLGQYQRSLQPYLGGVLPGISNGNGGSSGLFGSLATLPNQLLSGGGTDTLQSAAGPALSALETAGHDLLLLIITLAVAFFLLRDDHRLAGWIETHIIGEESATAAYFTAVDNDLSTVYFGNVITAVVIGVLATVTYNVLAVFAPAGVSVPAPTLLGLLTGVASLIPVVGMKLVYGPMTAVLAVEAFLYRPAELWFPVVFLVVSVLVFDSMFEFVLRPYISGRGLHTGLVLFSYLFGTILFGWYGLFLGPLLLVLLIHFARLILPGLLDGGELTVDTTTPDPLDGDETDDAGGSIAGWVMKRLGRTDDREAS